MRTVRDADCMVGRSKGGWLMVHSGCHGNAHMRRLRGYQVVQRCGVQQTTCDCRPHDIRDMRGSLTCEWSALMLVHWHAWWHVPNRYSRRLLQTLLNVQM